MNQSNASKNVSQNECKNVDIKKLDIKKLYKVGQEVEGKITSFFKAGAEHPDLSAFIKLSEGGSALLLYNEMPDYPRQKVADLYKLGENIAVDIIALRPNKNRVSVSLKSISLRRAAAKLERGDIVEGTVVSQVSYGYFVSIGGGMEALLHNDNLDRDFHGKREAFAIGEKTEVVILKIEDAGKRVGVGRIQLFE